LSYQVDVPAATLQD